MRNKAQGLVLELSLFESTTPLACALSKDVMGRMADTYRRPAFRKRT